MGSVALHEPVFPLDDHAEVLVVEQEDFDGQFLAEAGGEFLDVHLETTVAIDIDNERVRMSGLGAHGGGQSESHRAESAAAHPGSRVAEFVELGSPHLVLADADGDVGFSLGGDIGERLDRMLLQDAVEFGVVCERVLDLHFVAVFLPIRDIGFLNDPVQFGQNLFYVAADGDVGLLVFVQFGGVDIDVDNFGILGERFDFAGHSVVKPNAQRDQQVAIADRVVSVGGSVHPEPLERVGVVRFDGPDSHDGGDGGDTGFGDQGA